VVGGGFIGLEMAEAFRKRGLESTVVELLPTVMSLMDRSFGVQVARELRKHVVTVITGAGVKAVLGPARKSDKHAALSGPPGSRPVPAPTRRCRRASDRRVRTRRTSPGFAAGPNAGGPGPWAAGLVDQPRAAASTPLRVALGRITALHFSASAR